MDEERIMKIYLAIYTVTINGERNVEFSYDDPNIQILSEDDPRYSFCFVFIRRGVQLDLDEI